MSTSPRPPLARASWQTDPSQREHRGGWALPEATQPGKRLRWGPGRHWDARTFQAALHDVGHGAVGLHRLPDQQHPICIHLPNVGAWRRRRALCGAMVSGWRGLPGTSQCSLEPQPAQPHPPAPAARSLSPLFCSFRVLFQH